jgi:hypothetical protein
LKKSELVGRLSLRKNAFFYRLVEPVEKVIFHLKTLEEHGQTIIEIDI